MKNRLNIYIKGKRNESRIKLKITKNNKKIKKIRQDLKNHANEKKINIYYQEYRYKNRNNAQINSQVVLVI